MRFQGLGQLGRNFGVCGVVGLGLLIGTAVGQSAPSDMLIEPALYAVVGAPFTATVEWTSTETKGDGVEVHHRRVSRIMRDSAGRQRFEDGADEAASDGSVPPVRLYDPTKRMFASLDVTTGVAKFSTMGYTAATGLSVPASRVGVPEQPGAVSRADAPRSEGKPTSGVMRDPLPSREIAGLSAEGIRTTTTIPAGKDGSPAAIVVDDVWESPQWRMQLLHIHDDSRVGRSQAQVTELVREEPDAALFQAPTGYAKDNWEIEGQFRVVLPKSSPLPNPILDDNLATAADRVIAAATAHSDSLYTPYHERYELTMFDYKGQKHLGSVESWISTVGYRYEVHTDTYNYVRVADYGSRKQWEAKEGIEPLRVKEFTWDKIKPTYVELHLLHGGSIPKLKPVTIDGTPQMCGGIVGTARLCFDQATGFMTSATLNDEHVVYDGWQKTDTWKYREGTLRILHETNLLVEAKLTVASMEFSPKIFEQIEGLREIAPLRQPGSGMPPSPAPQHKILVRGTSAISRGANGYAQVRVWVDQHGVVSRAEVEDADDRQVAAAALESAQKTVYGPETENGQPTGFETTAFYVYTLPTAARP